MLMSVMDVGPMDVGMDDRFVNMLVLMRLCHAGIHMFMLMMFVVDMRMTMGEHRVRMKMHNAATQKITGGRSPSTMKARKVPMKGPMAK